MAKREPLTEEDRLIVRRYLERIVAQSGKGWDDIVYEARLKHSTVKGWRYGEATPEGPLFLRFLYAVGVIGDDYEESVTKAREELAQALSSAQHAREQAEDLANGDGLEVHAQDTPG